MRPRTERPALANAARVLLLTGALALPGQACRSERAPGEIATALGVGQAPGSGEGAADPLTLGLDRLEHIFVRDGVPQGERLRIVLGEARYADTSIELEAGHCYAFAGWGAPSDRDFDLRLDAPSGTPVAWDDAPDHFPVIERYCPSTSGTFNLRALRSGPGGEVLVGTWLLADGATRTAEREIDEARTRFLGDLPSRPLGRVQTTALVEGRPFEVAVAMIPGRCYAVVAVSAEVLDLDLELLGPDGTPVMRDLSTEGSPVLQPHCPAAGAAYRVRVKAYDGTGRVWWRLYETDAPVAAPDPGR